ncbi:MAG: class I SAM-dependent methyltransferase [Acidimicrobiales bacterium]|jgi:SAM-dependent methyltransferase|nr:class I SAM-dependent methyltransferase [Acidimicrobiales bacterium]
MDRGEDRNLDPRVVDGFGDEWSRFSNRFLDADELEEMFDLYTAIFPWGDLPDNAVGFDAGCGSGRWARFFAPRVGLLWCIDASDEALEVARQTLADYDNVAFRHEDLSSIGLQEASCDFGYSLGVLHHIPDTEHAAWSCVRLLKPGAPFLVYLYHDLSDRAVIQRILLKAVGFVRQFVARLPRPLRALVADLLAVVVYWPLARFARGLDRVGIRSSWVPLFQYRNRSFYVMRNDALDRFGTLLEKRYSRNEVIALMEGIGLEHVMVADGPPWWVAVGRRRTDDE